MMFKKRNTKNTKKDTKGTKLKHNNDGVFSKSIAFIIPLPMLFHLFCGDASR